MINNTQVSRYTRKILFSMMLVGMTPLIFIFIVYLNDPDSYLLYYIYEITKDIPSVTSAYSPLLTKVMDIYSKSALLFAVVTFFILYKRKPKVIIERSVLIKACIFSPVIYCLYLYFFLLQDFELTTAGNPARLMSGNNVSLLFFYVCLYYVSFLLTYMMCYLPSLVLALWKETKK